ncbi:expressed protein [Phakopsora pachyrhizi]|uniref:Expressed protein n=1 Tax=Phakopsora pachyrhizi TaxID=170000 RepID=A0AAV0BEL8_PHAPC|nr:expressed protein [Phakopsora pachyrhizi]
MPRFRALDTFIFSFLYYFYFRFFSLFTAIMTPARCGNALFYATTHLEVAAKIVFGIDPLNCFGNGVCFVLEKIVL